MPTGQIIVATTAAIATLVAMVLSQGFHPLRMSPTGSRCCKKNKYAGPKPNMMSGCR